MATPPSGWQPRSNPWIIAASVMLATFMEVLDTSGWRSWRSSFASCGLAT